MKKIVIAALLAVTLSSLCIPLLAAVTAEVRLGNVKAGDTYEFTIQVKNDSTDAANFDVYYKASGYPKDGETGKTGSSKGYTGIGDKAKDWVQMEETIAVPASSISNEKVTLSIPKDAALPNSWVFWIATVQTPSGNLVVENCCTVLVSMHHDNAPYWILLGVLGAVLVVMVIVLRRNK